MEWRISSKKNIRQSLNMKNTSLQININRYKCVNWRGKNETQNRNKNLRNNG